MKKCHADGSPAAWHFLCHRKENVLSCVKECIIECEGFTHSDIDGNEMKDMKNVGKMIYSLRCEKEMTQEELACGILSVPELSRIESGMKPVSGVVFEALLQRLGKSMDRMEYVTSKEAYREICLREMIGQALACEEYEVAEELLTEYRACAWEENVLCRQFVSQMETVVHFLRHGRVEECRMQMEQALELTYRRTEMGDLEEVWLCIQEMQCLLLVRYFQFLQGTADIKEVEKLVRYIDSRFTERKERAKIYPQSAWLAGEICYSEGNFKSACEWYKKGEACLAENGVLTLMSRVLEGERNCLKRLKRESEMEETEKKLSAIRFLYEKAQYRQTGEDILFFVMKSYQSEVIISNELLYDLRVGKGLSQEEVSEDICAQETLSRIERKKRTPNRNKLKQLLEKLDYDREFLQGHVVTDDYLCLELVGKISNCWYIKRKEEAGRYIDELEAKLDMKNPVNRQYIEHQRLIMKGCVGKEENERILERLKELLRYTMKDFENEIYREPTREEFVIINHMAICLKRLKCTEKAENLYRQVLERYHSSEVAARNHATSEFLLYINYVGLLELDNKLEEAEKLGWDGIRLMLECQRGDVAGTLLMNIACVYEKLSGSDNRQMAKACVRTSYYLLKLYQHKSDADRIKNYYEEKYEKIGLSGKISLLKCLRV